MRGQIAATKRSVSGKTLGVKFENDNQWYTTKTFDLESSVGQVIDYQVSIQEFPGGGACHWLNNEKLAPEPAATPMDAAFEAAMPPSPPVEAYNDLPGGPGPAPQAPITAPTGQKDRDASIVAQALTKACTGLDSPEKVFACYVTIYNAYTGWNPGEPWDALTF